MVIFRSCVKLPGGTYKASFLGLCKRILRVIWPEMEPSFLGSGNSHRWIGGWTSTNMGIQAANVVGWCGFQWGYSADTWCRYDENIWRIPRKNLTETEAERGLFEWVIDYMPAPLNLPWISNQYPSFWVNFHCFPWMNNPDIVTRNCKWLMWP